MIKIVLDIHEPIFTANTAEEAMKWLESNGLDWLYKFNDPDGEEWVACK